MVNTGIIPTTDSLSVWFGYALHAMSQPTPVSEMESESAPTRFRYQSKASRAERNRGLEGMEERVTDDGRSIPIDNPFLRGETKRSNHHPTVKSTALMRWLCRMVTPPNGTILDPFMGSGSTGVAAIQEGFDFIGIELDSDYCEIARKRIDHALRQGRQAQLEGTGS